MDNANPIVEAAHIKQTSFAGDVLKILSGTTIAQALSILASPILARLFAPEAFGVFALFSAITGILAAVFTLEYELAIMLPKRDSDGANLVAGSLGISLIFSLMMIPVVWLGGPSIARWLNAPALAPFLWFVPLVLVFGGIGAGHPVLNAWASRARRFTQISTSRVAGTLGSILGKLGFGFGGLTSGGGLIAGSLIGSILSPMWLGARIIKQDSKMFRESVNLERVWENLKRYRKFAIYNTPSALLNTISWQVPSFLLSAFFSPAIVGLYAFGNQLLRVPMDLVGSSIAQAFYSHAATAYQEGTLAEFVEATFRRLVEYSLFPILMLTVIGRDLFLIVFGAEWAEAGVYTQILSVWMVFWFISAPMGRLFNVLEKNEFSFRINVVILVTRIASIWLGGVFGDARLALVFFSVSGALVYGYLSISIMHISGVPLQHVGRILLQNLAIFVLAGTSILILKLLHTPVLGTLSIATLLITVYLAYRAKDEPRIREILGSLKAKQ